MKKLILFLTILFFLALDCVSQVPPVKILIGENENTVRKYFAELKSRLIENEFVKVEQTTSDDGQMMLKFYTPSNEESKTNSLRILAIFNRNPDKTEVCFAQAVMGSDTSVYKNLSYLKDNYKLRAKNEWVGAILGSNGKPMPIFKIIASFEKLEQSYYSITYKLTDGLYWK
jgi:hypothetical protein